MVIIKVLLLESGDFEFNSEVQSLYKGSTSGQQYYPLDGCRMRYFGGTTAMWGGYCSPFDEIDFRDLNNGKWKNTSLSLNSSIEAELQIGVSGETFKFETQPIDPNDPFLQENVDELGNY